MLVNGDAAEPPETIAGIIALKGQADAIAPISGLSESRTSSIYSAVIACGITAPCCTGPIMFEPGLRRPWALAIRRNYSAG
jgi:hypothetical protein